MQLGNLLTFKVEETEALSRLLNIISSWDQSKAAALALFRQTDGRCFLQAKLMAERGRSACSTHTQGRQACDHAITWTTGECLRRPVLCMCLHFACLVIFSWMPSQQSTQRLRSGFYEAETSHAQAKMLWHHWLHLSTMDRSVWCAFVLLGCDTAFQGRILRSRNSIHIPSELSKTVFWPQCLRLARLEDPHGLRHSIRFRHSSGEYQATKDRVRPN